MSGRARRRVRRVVILAACAGLVALGTSVSNAAIIRYGGLELRADGDFTPHLLPRHSFAPISIEGRANLRSTVGGPPPRLEQLQLDFDHDGRLSTTGLPTCDPASVEHASVAAARQKCAGSIVGTGKVEALVLIEARWIKVSAELTLFNGPPAGGVATVVAHAQPVSLPEEIYVVTIPIERIHGEYSYRATVEVPEIFNGTGILTGVEAKIGRRYKFQGKDRSYASARCSDGALSVHGHFTFAGGIIVDGAVEKFCVPKE